jgi:hypothetical protein
MEEEDSPSFIHVELSRHIEEIAQVSWILADT